MSNTNDHPAAAFMGEWSMDPVDAADMLRRERSALGRELHGGLCQHLTGMGYLLETLAMDLEQGPGALLAQVEKLQEWLDISTRQTRSLLNRLDPSRMLQDHHWLEALEVWLSVTNRDGLVTLVHDPEKPIRPASSDSAGWALDLIQWLILFGRSHHAQWVRIELEARGEGLRIDYRDSLPLVIEERMRLDPTLWRMINLALVQLGGIIEASTADDESETRLTVSLKQL